MKTSHASAVSGLSDSHEVVRTARARDRWAVGSSRPDAIVYPGSVQELAEILGRASEEGWSVVPAGAGTWIEGGGPVNGCDLVVSTRRLADVQEYEPGDLTLTAGAGLPLEELERVTGEHGQWLPQDPPGWRQASLGAFVATGLTGPLVTGFGRPRDHILGLTVVTGDGRILRPGGKVVKNVAGFDLVRLLTGSWGTLAVIAAATVRLHPRPEMDRTLLFGFPHEESADAVATARRLATAPVLPEALELLWPPPEGDGHGEEGVLVAARLLGSADAVEEKARILVDAADIEPVRGLVGDASSGFHDRVARVAADGGLVLRSSLLPSRLGDLLEMGRELRSRAREAGSKVRLHSFPSRGTLQIEIPGDGRGASLGGNETRVLSRVRERLQTDGGGMTVLSGPDDVVREIGARGERAGSARLIRNLKREFDPGGILCPGRVEFAGGGNV